MRSTLLQENSETAGGRIEGAEREWTVTTSGKVKEVEDFGSLIAAQRGGRLIYLRDVATVEDGLAEQRSIARLNGQRGVSLEIRRRSGSNTVAVARAIEEHYRPQGPNDAVPSDPVSITVALADKLDTLTGFWAIDEKPTGSKDPYALRLEAVGEEGEEVLDEGI